MQSKSYFGTAALALWASLGCSDDANTGEMRAVQNGAESALDAGTSTDNGFTGDASTVSASAEAAPPATTATGATEASDEPPASTYTPPSSSVAPAASGPVDPDGTEPFVPVGLILTKPSSTTEPLQLKAYTLLETQESSTLLATVTNEGQGSACDPLLSVEFRDKAGIALEARIGRIYAKIYGRKGTLGGAIACLGPGETAIAVVDGLSTAITANNLSEVGYQVQYFDREGLPFGLTPIDGFHVDQVEAVTRDTGSAYTGVFENQLDVTLRDAMVLFFPLNHVGRALGVAKSVATEELPAGGSWNFETTTIPDLGTDYVWHASGAIAIKE